ncbi:MAG TPA: preprotein translocase subunit SecE [Candidatus Acidoferrum sp.]|nr:preprotein translocase subunit SecE [Candidatus Acidoferrum sp.]
MPQQTAGKAKPKKSAKALLSKEVQLPVKGALGKSVHTPRWLRVFGGYFVGSWQELREVSWPNRRATWGLTFAVLLFTFVLVAFIFGIDTGFEQLFKGVIIK